MTDNAIVIGSDHAGYSLKQVLVAHLEEKGWTVVDVGTNGPDSVDYPDSVSYTHLRAHET